MSDKKSESTALKVRVPATELAAINQIVEESQLALSKDGAKEFDQAFTLAAALEQVGALISDDMLSQIMRLQGRSLGFRTDKDSKGGYDAATVKDCLIEACLTGARPVGNEFNIISGRPYFTKEFFVRRVLDDPAISDVAAVHGAIEYKGGNAYVDFVANWRVNGIDYRLEKVKKRLESGADFDDRVVCRVNEGMGYDAVIGKATRKMYRAILEASKVTAIVPTDGDIYDAESRPVEGKSYPQSKLFRDDEPSDRGDSASRANAKAIAVDEYRQKLADCGSKADVGRVVKQAGGDGRLDDTTRAGIMKEATKRQKGL